MTIGIIGLGSIGERHVRNLQKLYPEAKIDIFTKRLVWKDAKKNTHLVRSEARFYSTKHDVYFVTNETHRHVASIVRCLKQKPKGIFVEKPLSHDAKSAKKLARLLKGTRTVLMLGYCLQFFEPLLKLKKMLAEKKIGEPLYIRASAGQDLRTWRPGDYRVRYSAHAHKGGGAILDLIHELNYPAWLLDDQLIFHAGWSGHISKLKITVEDIAEGVFLSRRGVPVSIHVDYLQNPGRRYCEIGGTKGTLIWEWPARSTTHRIWVRTGKKENMLRLKVDVDDMYVDEVSAFMRHVRTKDGYNNLTEALADLSNAGSLKRAKRI